LSPSVKPPRGETGYFSLAPPACLTTSLQLLGRAASCDSNMIQLRSIRLVLNESSRRQRASSCTRTIHGSGNEVCTRRSYALVPYTSEDERKSDFGEQIRSPSLILSSKPIGALQVILQFTDEVRCRCRRRRRMLGPRLAMITGREGNAARVSSGYSPCLSRALCAPQE
jgi:hypothetical protein